MSDEHHVGAEPLDAYQLRLTWIGVVGFSERWSASAAVRPTWRLSYRDAGEARIHYPSETIALPLRRPVLIAPAAASSAKPEGEAQHLLVEFELSGLPCAGQSLESAPLALAADELRDRLCGRLLRDLGDGASAGSSTYARAKAITHLAVASAFEASGDAAGAHGGSEDVERQLRPVLRYIDAHLNEPLDNTRLAALVHASESHFIRSFRRLMGSTPARHVQERRVLRAAELLAATALSIDEIADRCGFANRYHFSRVFAQRMASPPGRYRATHGPRLP